MFCRECGTENPAINRFCKNCGKPLVQGQLIVPITMEPTRPAASPPVPVASPSPAAFPVPAVPPASVTPPVTVASPSVSKKKKRNWIGILALILGILSWAILTVPLAILAIVIGSASLFMMMKSYRKISFSGLAGIIFAMASVAVSMFV
jgi:hypothetical protein